tara:strand:- start:2778 stop:3473 length:696 start_codon:yes stop_codon:yes gene_type:complete
MRNYMKHTVFENAIPLEVCREIKDFFDDNPDLQIHKPNNPNVVKINHPWRHLEDRLRPILSKYFDPNKGSGGNIYKHTNLYSLHVDSDEPTQMINVNIPIHLEVTDPPQHFMVFDQYTDNGFGQTWYGKRKDINNYNFDRNKKVPMSPYEDPRVYDCTEDPIDEKFYSDYLEFNNHTPELFHGLTGTAYDWRPGNMVVFNSNNLHCTGKLVGPWKMGLLINFEGTVEELLV